MKKNNRILSFVIFPLFVFLSLTGLANEPYSSYTAAHSSKSYFSVYIMDKGQSSAMDLRNMMLFYNPDLDSLIVETIAEIYVYEAEKEGVNQDIAFIQMCLETGFLTYTGSVKPYQNNFAGLGAVNKHTKGEYFPDIQTGVRAHIQHLKAYASTLDLFHKLVDSRFRFVKRGVAPTIYDLPGRWAADKDYAIKLEDLLTRLFFIRNQNTFQYSFVFFNFSYP